MAVCCITRGRQDHSPQLAVRDGGILEGEVSVGEGRRHLHQVPQPSTEGVHMQDGEVAASRVKSGVNEALEHSESQKKFVFHFFYLYMEKSGLRVMKNE